MRSRTADISNGALQTLRSNGTIPFTRIRGTLFQVYQVLGTDDYFWIKGCLWNVLRYMVIDAPTNENKCLEVRG
jgi:hypothetical protein